MILAVLAVVGGLTLMVLAGLAHRRHVDDALEELLGMAPAVVPEDRERAVSVLAGRAVDLAGHVVEHVDSARSLGLILEQAKIPLRPGEFVIVVGGAALGVAAVLIALTHVPLLAVAGAGASVLVATQVVRRRVARRRKAFTAQLPDALGLAASSLSAGHTFLRAIQMMCEESQPPLSEEFGRVVSETRLGDPVVNALERMAKRLEIRDMDMVVQAIRIQQTVGGRLAALLHTLAEFIRAREEVRREVRVLTAEGRMSAYVLAGLVPFLFVTMRFVNPDYLLPLYHGWGLGVLAGCAGSVLIGLFVIFRMVRIDV
ncbi:MAG: type II secretion system F family protein [Acidimicrobiales bacterium]